MATAQAQTRQRPQLLFVDDEQRVLNSMRIMFRREFDLHLASSGAEAIRIVEDNDIDVIVSDHRMPEMTGVEVLSRVREVSPRTVRILLTGYADLDSVEGSINEGEVFRFLTKPCPLPQLKDTVARAAALAMSSTGVATKSDEFVDNLLEDEAEPAAAEPAAAAPQQAPARQQPARAAGATGRSAPPKPAAGPAADEPAPDPGSTARIRRPDLSSATAKRRKVVARGLGIIVFSADEEVRNTIQKAVRGRVPVYPASNIVQVVKILAEHQPGVLLTDVSDDKATIQAMTARLKEHLPELVTIAVSEHRDVLDMVWLINHGQIFRFLRKPLSPGRCAVCLQAALKHHFVLLRNPELVRRHAVEASEGGGIVENMLAKMKRVRRLWESA